MRSKVDENARLLNIWKKEAENVLGQTNFTTIDQKLWFRIECPCQLRIKDKNIFISFYAEIHVFDYYEQYDVFNNVGQMGFFSQCKKEYVEKVESNFFDISLTTNSDYLTPLGYFEDTLNWKYKSFNALVDDNTHTCMISMPSNKAEYIIKQFFADCSLNLTSSFQEYLLHTNGYFEASNGYSETSEEWHFYENVSGRSNIAKYKIGVDYIAVKFYGTDKIYEYTYSSVGKYHVDKMKELAHQGFGLNSYIMKDINKK